VTAGIPAEVARSLAAALAGYADKAATLARALEGRTAGASLPLPWGGVLPDRTAALRAAADDFRVRGWAVPTPGGAAWRATGNAPRGLADFLQGVAAMAAARPDRGTFRAVVTPPLAPSAFGEALRSVGMARADLVATNEAMRAVAEGAVRRLTVLTPFANGAGMAFVEGLFALTRAGERTLVLRLRNASTRAAHAQAASRLQALGVRVLDYTRPAPDGGYETFHAKAVLADEAAAYVGSANLLRYARHSLELGVLLQGPGVEVVAAAVRAVERAATKVDPSNYSAPASS
jgi:hypothetical protein